MVHSDPEKLPRPLIVFQSGSMAMHRDYLLSFIPEKSCHALDPITDPILARPVNEDFSKISGLPTVTYSRETHKI